MKINQKGFGVVYNLFIVLLVCFIVFAGWLVYEKRSGAKQSSGSDVFSSKIKVTDQIFSRVNLGGGDPGPGVAFSKSQTQVIGFFKKPLEVTAVSIEYGKSPTHFTSVDAGFVTDMQQLDGVPEYSWTLAKLEPGTKYYYHIGATVKGANGEQVLFSPVSSFTTQK